MNEVVKNDADSLTEYAIEVRYPDDFYMPELEETKTCIEIAIKSKNFIREKLQNKGFQLL